MSQIVDPGVDFDTVPLSRSRPKPLLSNAGWGVLSIGWFTVTSLLLTPFLIARLGTDHYGLFALLTSVSGLLGIMDLGLGQATLRYVAYYYGRNDLAGINRTVSATFSVYIVMGALAWAVLFFGAPWVVSILAVPPEDCELTIKLVHLTATSFGVMLVSGVFGSIPKALQRYDVDTAAMIAQSVFQLAGTVVILLAGSGIYMLVVWGLITTVFRQSINVLVAKQLIPTLRFVPSPSKSGLREVLGFGVFATLSQTLGIVWREADRLLLGTLVSAAAVGYLSVPKNLVLRGSSAVSAAGGVLFARFSATDDLKEVRRLFLDATWSMLCASIVLFVPITVLFPDFLRLWIGPEFAAESAWAGQVLAFSFIFRGAFVPYHGLFQGLGKPQYLTVIYLGSGLTILGLNLLWIPAFGLAGAGYAYIIALVWGFSGLLYAWKWIKKATPWRPLVRAVLFPSMLALVSLGLCATLLSVAGDQGWVGLVVLGAAFAGGTAALLAGADWLSGRRDSHVGTLLRAVFRLIKSSPGVRLAEAHFEGRT